MNILSVITLSVLIVTVTCQLDLPSSEYLPPQSDDKSAKLAEDGYQYRTVKKLKYRHRRDVNELPNTNIEYLPPTEDKSASEPEPVVEAAPAHKLGDNGYEYRGIRKLRYRYRHRRDVSDAPNAEYLPPISAAEEEKSASEPKPIVEAAPAHKLGDNGYEYRGVRKIRYRYRHRRDVSELKNSEYLPPSVEEKSASEQKPIVQDAPPLEGASSVENASPSFEAAPAHKLGDNGYEYRGVRRIRYRYRHRRDVSELPNVEYLPPAEEKSPSESKQIFETALAIETPAPAHKLGNNGYEYRGVRKLRYRYRHRRDVSELPNVEYLPPKSNSKESIEQPSASNVSPVTSEPEPAHKLNNKGYEYKTVRKLKYKYRHRRDISSDAPNVEYLPPSVEYLPPIDGAASEPKPAHLLANDGYRYKTSKKYKFRLRRH